MIIAEILGHELIHSKRDADACDLNDPNLKYEYLSCYGGGSGQFDRMFKEPEDKRQLSLNRIRRNQKIYFAVFSKKDALTVKVIYEIESEVLVTETD